MISPYDAQVQRLGDRIDIDCEIDTVNGFQGREKEAVLVSLVRSNPEDEIGFLDEPRRFNDASSWLRYYNDFPEHYTGDPLLFNDWYEPKPAYDVVVETLEEY